MRAFVVPFDVGKDDLRLYERGEKLVFRHAELICHVNNGEPNKIFTRLFAQVYRFRRLGKGTTQPTYVMIEKRGCTFIFWAHQDNGGFAEAVDRAWATTSEADAMAWFKKLTDEWEQGTLDHID